MLAKPAEQTPAIAYRVVELLYAAGIPRQAFQLLPGRGIDVGTKMTANQRHFIRFRARDLESTLDEINNTGYGLTLGVHSRLAASVCRALALKLAGHTILLRFATERTLTINTTAVGGNASLLELD